MVVALSVASEASGLKFFEQRSPPTFLENETEQAWNRSRDELRRMCTLRDDWDKAGAVAPSLGAIATAIELLDRMRRQNEPPTYVAASPSGSVVIEWVVGRRFIEAEIDIPDVVYWMLQVQGQPTRHVRQSLARSEMPTETGALAIEALGTEGQVVTEAVLAPGS